jgi:hypothetical protein
MPENYWLATMDSWDGMPDHEANARLIAAAPEMLALLRRWSETTCDHGAQDFCPREDARALLAKVERSA